ncbi:MAG: hypothetical protein WC796_00720 [Candidatus Pacearchaeota archaeon]
MDSFIKKIFSGKRDEFVHLQFQKFSKGEFRNKALVNVSKSKDNYSIATTYEYVNEFVRSVASRIKDGEKVKVSGVIVSTRNLRELPEFSKLFGNVEIKQFMGVKQFKISTEMTGKEIVGLCDSLPNSFLALSFSIAGTELKVKPKAPKSAKPSTSDKPIVPDFCKIKTGDISLVREVLFDVDEFKKVAIGHDFIITGLEIPKNESDPLKMREKTIRKGKIVRRLNIDGKELVKERDFEA